MLAGMQYAVERRHEPTYIPVHAVHVGHQQRMKKHGKEAWNRYARLHQTTYLTPNSTHGSSERGIEGYFKRVFLSVECVVLKTSFRLLLCFNPCLLPALFFFFFFGILSSMLASQPAACVFVCSVAFSSNKIWSGEISLCVQFSSSLRLASIYIYFVAL